MALAVATPQFDSHRSKRTEAMPKHSLFGTALEKQDTEMRESLNNIDISQSQQHTHRSTNRYKLPESVRRELSASKALEKTKVDIGIQKEAVDRAKENLRKKEEQALVFGASLSDTGVDPGTERSQQWLTRKDLEGAKEINTVGLNEYQSYNRDKYGPRAPVHQYSLIGDLLKPGMDMPRRERTFVQNRNLGYGHGDIRNMEARRNVPSPHRETKSAAPSPRRSLDLPPNIKHQFGSKICDRLLSDDAKVQHTIRSQAKEKEMMQRPSKPFSVPQFSKDMKEEYETLGNYMRQNVFAGYSMNHKISTTKSEHNDQVHLFRNPDPDQWRMKRDDLSTWSEHQVLRDRMLKSWEKHLQEMPKAEANWDRSAKRPITVPETKTASKPKPKSILKKTDKGKDDFFEDVKFETPPVTPPPQPLSPARLNTEGFKRDNEFWDFYDKPSK